MKSICLVLLLIAPEIWGQTDRYDSLITAGIDQIYGIEFEKAENTFLQLRNEFPDQPAALFFDAMITWWKILVDLNNEDYDEIFYDKLEKVIDFCDEIIDQNPGDTEALFFKGGALGFRGRLRAIRQDFLNAALDGKDALPLVFQVYEIDPENIDVLLGFGIYNYYAEVIPEEYPVVKPFMILFPDGDKNLGLKQLKETAANGKYAKIESRYFLMTLLFQYEKDQVQAKKYADMLLEKFPNNPIFERYSGRIEIKLSGYLNSAPIWESIYRKCKSGAPEYNNRRLRESSYYLGMKYFLTEKFDSSMVFFEEAYDLSVVLDRDEDTGWLVNSALYLGEIYDILGFREGAIEMYKKVLGYDEYQSSHEKAEKYLKKPFGK